MLSIPYWFQEGIYVEYVSDKGAYLKFYNGTSLDTVARVTFRWEVMDIKEGEAKLNIRLVGEFGTAPLTVYVDIRSRDVFLANETEVGKTYLWLLPFAERGQKFELIRLPPDTVVWGTVVDEGYRRTTQGMQLLYTVTTTPQQIFVTAYYDKDTGLLVECPFFHHEGTLVALGIEYMLWREMRMYTNVNLGPSDVLRDVLALMLVDFLYLTILLAASPLLFVLIRKRLRRSPAPPS